MISSIALAAYLGLKTGAVANGMEMEAALEQIREEYGRRGYLDATVQPETSFDDAAHTVSYKIAIAEGKQYHMGGWVITGDFEQWRIAGSHNISGRSGRRF